MAFLISKLEQRILETLLYNLDKKLSIHQIANLLKTSYSHVYNKTRELLKEKLLIKETIGNSTILYLNLKNDLLRNAICHIELLRRNRWLKSHASIKEFFEKTESYQIDSVFFYANKIMICIDNFFVQTMLSDFLNSHFKELHKKVVFLSKKEVIPYLKPVIVAKKIAICNPDWYYKQLSDFMNHDKFK